MKQEDICSKCKMIICIIFVALFILFLSDFVVEYISDIKLKPMIERIEQKHSENTYSVSEYYKRMEKYSLSLQSEKESKNPYMITLWWGYDGLRLNEDGTTEWISRKPKPLPEPDYYSQQSMNCILQAPSQMQSQILQQQQTIQMQNMISQLNPPIYPAYMSQLTIGQLNPLYNPLLWTCCGTIETAVQKNPDVKNSTSG